jgi:glycosyltransferase involved in cell wall biosynthesis
MRYSGNNEMWIIANADFPEGRGGTSRIRNIAVGLTSLGYSVKILIPHSAGYVDQGQNLHKSGYYKKVYFTYLNGDIDRPKTEMAISFWKLYGNIDIAVKILFSKQRPNLLLIYNYSLIDTGLVLFAAKILHIKIILDICDERFDLHASGWMKSILRKINAWQLRLSDEIFFRFSDGFFCVSSYLKSKIERLGNHQPIIMLPLVAGEFPDLNNNPTIHNGKKIIAYVGSIIPDEGLETLLQSVLILKSETKDVKCLLYGGANNEQYFNQLQSQIISMDLQKEIVFMGNVPYSNLPDELQATDVVVLPRPDTIISRAGFPGKLVEYLSSGRPIVTTPFGDISLFFSNNKSVFMANDFSVRSFANALSEALYDPYLSNTIGRNGRDVGLKYFSQSGVARQIDIFIKSNFKMR